jgi:FAD/FMN-containing dehydrogenase
VKWAIAHNVRFLVHNGGNGWATTLNITSDDITINLDQLRSITFNAAKTQVTLGGGALIADVVQAASANNVLVATGSCNCVGYLGAVLGGGLSALQGMYGLGVDELLSLNVVDATGKLTSVTPSNTELWYALRGAGPNFGIVTSAVVRAHPVAQSGLQAWTGSLIFRPDQLEAIVQTTQNLSLRPEMALTLTFINQPATASQIIIASPFYYGSTEAGRAAFKPLLDIGPVADATAVTPYASWNNGSNTACQKGGRRPTWGVGLAHMNPASWSEVYKVWLDLVKQPGAERSSMLLNAYSTTKVRSVPDSSSAVPWRRTINFHASLTAFYTNASFDATALSYGQKARALWRSGDGLCPDAVYINNAFGDESQQTIYGNSLAKLSPLKKKYDPLRRFSQWFPL